MKRGFFDPLYKVVVLQDPATFRPRSALSLSSTFKIRKAVTPLIDSFEFTRLSRLRQSGLLYNVFPSATHSRYAHSLGCCHLGFAACSSVKIRDYDNGDKQDLILQSWLAKLKWEEEFLIALLLHDLGHFAFSHLMEGNPRVSQCLEMQLNHEQAACDLILGHGPAFDAMNTLAGHTSNSKSRIHSVLKGIDEAASDDNRLEMNLICYLISGKLSYLDSYSDRQKRQAKILHALTSGLLDLDRIDHYRRDSEFTGLEIGFNYQALLHGLTIVGIKVGDLSGSIKLILDRDAVGHGLSLLHMRERLTTDCFLHPKCMSLDAMCNWALGEFVESELASGVPIDEVKSFILLADDELLGRMRCSDNPKVAAIASRLSMGDVYEPFCCFVLKTEHDLSEISKFVEKINSDSEKSELLLYKPHPSLRKSPQPGQEWLDLECLLDAKGNRLGQSPRYKNQIEHFKRSASAAQREVWFFSESSDSSTLVKLKDQIKESDFWESECSI